MRKLEIDGEKNTLIYIKLTIFVLDHNDAKIL